MLKIMEKYVVSFNIYHGTSSSHGIELVMRPQEFYGSVHLFTTDLNRAWEYAKMNEIDYFTDGNGVKYLGHDSSEDEFDGAVVTYKHEEEFDNFDNAISFASDIANSQFRDFPVKFEDYKHKELKSSRKQENDLDLVVVYKRIGKEISEEMYVLVRVPLHLRIGRLHPARINVLNVFNRG